MVRATCCICLEHKDILRPWNANPKCCNALVCLKCAKKWRKLSDTCPQCRQPRVQPSISLDWRDKFNIFMAITCLLLPFVLFACGILSCECPKHVIDPSFKCPAGPPGVSQEPRGPMGPVGPPGPPGEIGFVGPPGICVNP